MSIRQVVLTRKAAMTMGALHSFLKPKLAQDAKLDLTRILGRVTSKNFDASKPAIVTAVTKAVDGKLAKDASVAGLAELLDALGEEKGGGMDDPLPLETDPNGGLPALRDKSMDEEGPDAGIHDKIKMFLKDKLSPEDMMTVEQLIGSETADAALGSEKGSEEGEDEEMDEKDKKAKDEPPPFKGKPEVGGGAVTKDSMTKAIKGMQQANDAAIKTAVKAAQEEAGRVREAERFVRPWVGDMAMAHDSADAVYCTALTALGVDVKGVHPSAFRAILERVPQPGKNPRSETVAMDSAAGDDFARMYPDAMRIKLA